MGSDQSRGTRNIAHCAAVSIFGPHDPQSNDCAVALLVGDVCDACGAATAVEVNIAVASAVMPSAVKAVRPLVRRAAMASRGGVDVVDERGLARAARRRDMNTAALLE
ncbi:hypothetical protein GCM10023317_73760 [Actinopolymorpha pittospori]